MAIDISKVLTCSFEDYAKSEETTQKAFREEGVCVSGYLIGRKSPKERFSEEVPEETEVVVDYIVSMTPRFADSRTQAYFEANGTALTRRS